MKTEIPTGWLCPRCGKIVSPFVECCSCRWENKPAEEKVTIPGIHHKPIKAPFKHET